MLFTSIIAYIDKIFNLSGRYGSELEKYIISKYPQSTYDVEYWTNEFDRQQFQKGWPL